METSSLAIVLEDDQGFYDLMHELYDVYVYVHSVPKTEHGQYVSQFNDVLLDYYIRIEEDMENVENFSAQQRRTILSAMLTACKVYSREQLLDICLHTWLTQHMGLHADWIDALCELNGWPFLTAYDDWAFDKDDDDDDDDDDWWQDDDDWWRDDDYGDDDDDGENEDE